MSARRKHGAPVWEGNCVGWGGKGLVNVNAAIIAVTAAPGPR